MNIRAPRWSPHRDRREDLGKGIGRSRPCVMGFGMEIGKYLDMGLVRQER